LKESFPGVAGQAGHQVQAGFKSTRLEQLHGRFRGPGIMAAPNMIKDLIIEGLGADFNGPDAVGVQKYQLLAVNVIGSCGNPDRFHLAFLNIDVGPGQKPFLIIR